MTPILHTKPFSHKIDTTFHRLQSTIFNMAPNRKSLSTIGQVLSSNDLADLQTTIQPKYAPLTVKSNVDISEESACHSPVSKCQEPASYWDWSSPVEEVVVCVLSTDNIVSNLIQSAEASDETNTREHYDCYWAEESSVHTEEVSKQPIHTTESSYWDWPADQDVAEATVRSISEEERAQAARQLLVAGNIVSSQLQQDAAKLLLDENIQTSNDDCWSGHDKLDNYWDMPAFTTKVPTLVSTGYWDM